MPERAASSGSPLEQVSCTEACIMNGLVQEKVILLRDCLHLADCYASSTVSHCDEGLPAGAF